MIGLRGPHITSYSSTDAHVQNSWCLLSYAIRGPTMTKHMLLLSTAICFLAPVPYAAQSSVLFRRYNALELCYLLLKHNTPVQGHTHTRTHTNIRNAGDQDDSNRQDAASEWHLATISSAWLHNLFISVNLFFRSAPYLSRARGATLSFFFFLPLMSRERVSGGEMKAAVGVPFCQD